jgi:hypothetical protein
MGWRDELICSDAVETAAGLLAMPAPDRIALARELLPEGFVVAREVGEREWSPPTDGDIPTHSAQHVDGWNACRAAMMGEGE